MFIEYRVVFAYIIGIVLLYFLGKYFPFPMKIAIKLIFNSVLGAIALLAINFSTVFFGYNIAVNPATAAIAGVLGIPGILLLVILKQIFQV